ncbi:MAG TPA: GNAT family N-acetyltransferase [Coriobacteriia bacterium]
MPYELLAGHEALDSARGDWEALQTSVPIHIFQTYDFARLWYDAAGRRAGAFPMIVTYAEDGCTTGLFPACLVRYGPARLLTWLAGPHVLDYGDIVFDASASRIPAEEFVAEALRLLRASAPLAFPYLTNVRDDAAASGALGTGMRAYKHCAAPYLPLGGDFDGYLASLSRHRRHDLRRTLAKLDEAGEVRFRLLSREDADLDAVIERLMELKRSRYGRTAFRGGTEAFRKLQAREERHTFVGALTVGGVLAAAEMVCIYRDRMYLLLPGFDEAFAAYAPGKAVRYHLIRECFARGLETCDFCWGGAEHKYQWTDLETRLTTFVSGDLRGALLAGVAGGRRRRARSGAEGEGPR